MRILSQSYRGRTNEGHTSEDIVKKRGMAIKISAPWVFRVAKWARGAAHRYSARALKLLFLERVRTGAFAHLQNSLRRCQVLFQTKKSLG